MLADKFYFPSNNGGEVKGISDSGIETFRGNSIKGLGREILQNSLDANKEVSDPAYVEFDLFSMEFDKIPGNNSLKDAFIRSKEFWEQQTSKKAKKFFEDAIEKSNKEVSIMRISDFNTTGLTGVNSSYNSPWVNLTKASGVSDKINGNMGSFGIGKFATFAASDFRTVFYNTVAIDGGKAFQGVARLTSFEDENNTITQGIGYIGSYEANPSFENLSLDPNFKRKDSEYGTDIYIMGFKNIENNWQEEIISAVIDGFLYAIYIGELVVKVGSILINKETLGEIIEEYKDYFTEGADQYYKVLTSIDSHYFEENYRNHGLIKLWILQEENLNNKVAIFRGAGMKIKDRPFNMPLISGSGVMLIEGEAIQNKLIPLENPTHTDWEINRAETDRPYMKEYIRGIYEMIKNKLSNLISEIQQDEIDSDVGEFLPLISKEDDQRSVEEAVSDKIKVSYLIERRNKGLKSKGIETNDAEYMPDDSGEHVSNVPRGRNRTNKRIIDPDNKNDYSVPEDQNGNDFISKNTTLQPLEVSNLRILAQKKEEGRYVLSFIPSKDYQDSKIVFSMLGEDVREECLIIDARTLPNQNLKISKNVVTGLALKKNVFTKLLFTVDFDDYVAMEVKVFGI